MPKLTKEQKRFLVGEAASFSTPSEAAEAVKDRFGIEVTRQLAGRYDPTTSAGQELSKELTALFWELRKRFREELDDIPIANKAWNLRQLHRGVQEAKRMKNWVLVKDLIETAERIIGGAFTNAQVLRFQGQLDHQHSGGVLLLPSPPETEEDVEAWLERSRSYQDKLRRMEE